MIRVPPRRYDSPMHVEAHGLSQRYPARVAVTSSPASLSSHDEAFDVMFLSYWNELIHDTANQMIAH